METLPLLEESPVRVGVEDRVAQAVDGRAE